MKKRTSQNGRPPQTKVFNVRLESLALEKLRVIAEQEHRTVTNLIQVLVAEGITQREANQ
jgi:hypothetical protein